MKAQDAVTKETVFIRSDGFVFSQESMERLKEGGHKGRRLADESLERQLGERYRVLKPLDPDAAAIVKGVKGLVSRAVFVSDAIVKEYIRRGNRI